MNIYFCRERSQNIRNTVSGKGKCACGRIKRYPWRSGFGLYIIIIIISLGGESRSTCGRINGSTSNTQMHNIMQRAHTLWQKENCLRHDQQV